MLRERLAALARLVLPSTGRITQHLFVSWPKALVVVALCVGMTALFGWGLTQFARSPLLAVVSAPMGLFFVGTTLMLLTWLRPGRPQLSIDDAGLVDRRSACASSPSRRRPLRWSRSSSRTTESCSKGQRLLTPVERFTTEP